MDAAQVEALLQEIEDEKSVHVGPVDGWCGRDFASRYHAISSLIPTPRWWYVPTAIIIAANITYWITTLTIPDSCDGGVVMLFPCPKEYEALKGVIVTGQVTTVPCGDECDDCFSVWNSGALEFGGGQDYGMLPEAYAVQLMPRIFGVDDDATCNIDLSDWACVELCRATMITPDDPENYYKSRCYDQGDRCPGLWVSTLEEDCVVLGGASGEEGACVGSTAGVDQEADCSSRGAPFASDVGDWLRWKSGLGFQTMLYEPACITNDDDCGCDGDGEPASPSCGCGGGGGRNLLGMSGGTSYDDRDDLVPHGIDCDDVYWLMLPPGDYTWLRPRRHTSIITAALLVTHRDRSRSVTPLEQALE